MRLNKMSVKHYPEIAELYITPRNLGFYECNGVEAVALGGPCRTGYGSGWRAA